jgi:antitoxin (DNA-binding transcriptional repressor) of toxin-antitoxin stability system
MYTVGLKVLKNKLSEYVKLAAAGETVLVTDRTRVVAELGPPRPGLEGVMSDAVLARGIREGWLAPPTYPATGPPPRKPVKGLSLDKLLADLDRDRDDR